MLSWKAVGLKSVNKIYDPFEILGVPSVRLYWLEFITVALTILLVVYRKRNQVAFQETFTAIVRV